MTSAGSAAAPPRAPPPPPPRPPRTAGGTEPNRSHGRGGRSKWALLHGVSRGRLAQLDALSVGDSVRARTPIAIAGASDGERHVVALHAAGRVTGVCPLRVTCCP